MYYFYHWMDFLQRELQLTTTSIVTILTIWIYKGSAYCNIWWFIWVCCPKRGSGFGRRNFFGVRPLMKRELTDCNNHVTVSPTLDFVSFHLPNLTLVHRTHKIVFIRIILRSVRHLQTLKVKSNFWQKIIFDNLVILPSKLAFFVYWTNFMTWFDNVPTILALGTAPVSKFWMLSIR